MSHMLKSFSKLGFVRTCLKKGSIHLKNIHLPVKCKTGTILHAYTFKIPYLNPGHVKLSTVGDP